MICSQVVEYHLQNMAECCIKVWRKKHAQHIVPILFDVDHSAGGSSMGLFHMPGKYEQDGKEDFLERSTHFSCMVIPFFCLGPLYL